MSENQFDASGLSVLIPAFNEGAAIGKTLAALCEEPRLRGCEIIVVDDGSCDDTAEQVRSVPSARLLRHSVNKGYGAALTTGVHAATRDFICWFDADGQHRVEDLVAVARRLMVEELDYCVGVRGASSYQVPSRRLGKIVLKHTVRLAAGRAVNDFNSGLRGFRSAVLRRYLHLMPKGFGASTTTTLLMSERGYIGAEVPITVLPRIGKSSVKQIRDGMRTLMLILRIFLLFKPMVFFGAIGLGSAVLGLVYGTWVAIADRIGFPVAGAVLLIFGAQTFFFGLVVDQISAMRRERFE